MALIIIPIISGIIFVATVFINHALFESQIITARQAIGYEITIFLLGFVATIIQFPFAVKWLLKKMETSSVLLNKRSGILGSYYVW